VSPEPIESGQPFTATLGGTALFDESFLDAAQDAFAGGVKEVDMVEFKATVHVRSGATGDDVVLELEPIPYQCFRSRTACDPVNDVLADPPKPPGLRGNTECEPVSDANPCGRFIALPISSDCEPGGLCDDLGKIGPASQCDNNRFCITGGLPLALQEATGRYTADIDKTEVLFGWDDQGTGATLQEGGPDDGTWILPPAIYAAPTGPNGFRATVRGLPGALECTMGVNCADPDLGTRCFDPLLSSPTPNEALVSFPIQTEMP